MYDLDGDDKISKDELLSVLHMMVGANISEEQVMTLNSLICSHIFLPHFYVDYLLTAWVYLLLRLF